ncbi:hypothetical protein [Stieleria varia]|uniref:Uncharacterized protein n=1 Tax=Stieleria varia TaxID=2528005 RepID=A0A5C6B445_9BACT|nr:hypothetical protein [Stieleria varia]TWU06517.1 hypothetical protein Pla52n_22390 [Stieleria varia]
MKAATLPPITSLQTKSAENDSPPTNPGHHRKKPKPKETLKRSQADKRIDFLLKKHFDDDPDFRPLILELAELDPTPKKKYLAWLVKHWTGQWNPTDADQKRVTKYLETHHKGAKYFSPLSWTGLRLEDAGYHADIFRYTPESLATLGGRIAEIIRIDEEDKRIRMGEPVALDGSEIVHQDDKFTIIRIRTTGALQSFGQDTSWCVRHGDPMNYSFPFDFILDHEGNRYLANGMEVKDRWDMVPCTAVRNRINELRSNVSDSHEIEKAKRRDRVERAIQEKRKLTGEETSEILQDVKLAIRYATEVIGGPWRRFEQHVRVADLTARQAVDYAVTVRKKRWRKFENKIKRSVGPLANYRRAFPGSIAKSDEEIFMQQLKDWRTQDPQAHWRPSRWSNQGHAESRQRDACYEVSLLDRRYSFDRYCRFLASIATSEMANRYRLKLKSYFSRNYGEGEEAKSQLEIAREMCRRLNQRVQFLEISIAKDPICSLNYAKAIGERFVRGEEAIMADPKLAHQYRRIFLRSGCETEI